ncbi:B2 protein [Spatholobus suberectus]|nr:B2 protein [Spatholobus suberectus]
MFVGLLAVGRHRIQCSVSHAKLWALVCGLHITVENGFRSLEIESDSLTAVKPFRVSQKPVSSVSLSLPITLLSFLIIVFVWMRAGRRTQTYNISRTIPFSPNSVVSSVGGRNLGKYQLGGVIFGCKNSTMKECQSKQLFGLPAPHFSYVKNIDPGLPIFLFNYSDRKLHGIFEASSKGQMYIDPYAWIDDYSELDRTQYPAQVKIRVRLQCQPLSEDKFAQVIADNYYTTNHFWFELDHRQASKLTSLLASLAFAPGCNLKWRIVSPSLPSTMKEGEAFETPESKTQHLTSSSRRTDSTEITSSLDGDMKPLDTQAVVKEVNENEMNLIYVKLKELSLGHESQNLSMSENVNDTPDENDMCTVEKDDLEVAAGLEEKEESSSPSVEHQNNIGQLMQEVEELMALKKTLTQKNCYLEQKLREAELEIQHLKDRCTMLESTFNLPLTHVGNTVIQSSAIESLFLKVNFDGESWLSTVDFYCPSQNVIKSLYPMNSAHSYPSITQLNVGSYSPILNKWTLYPSLNQKKGSLAVVSLTNKIFVVDDANGIDSFSDVGVFDLDIGRWTSARSMLDKSCALAAGELNGLLYTTTGYNGFGYLKFALGGFDKSRMIPSIKVIDSSFDMDDGETNERKTSLILSRNISVIGEVKVNKNIVHTLI